MANAIVRSVVTLYKELRVPGCLTDVGVEGRPGRIAAAVVIATALLAEQINAKPIAQIDRDAERAKFARIGAPPRDCRQFYVLRAPTNETLPTAEGQIDAMFVAYRYELPTLNGWSGNVPPGWNLNFSDGGSAARARAWAAAHGVADHLCVLDLDTGAWSRDGATGP
jgi:hypothetical protein